MGQNDKYICLILSVINVATYLVYAMDKLFAKLRWRRISERTLVVMSLLFGGVGALLAMITCRHKTKKAKFWFYVSLSIILQGGLIVLYYRYKSIFCC